MTTYEKLPKYTCDFCLKTKFGEYLYKISPPITHSLGILYCHKQCLPEFKKIFLEFLNSIRYNGELRNIENLISKKQIRMNDIFNINDYPFKELYESLDNINHLPYNRNLLNSHLSFLMCLGFWEELKKFKLNNLIYKTII